MTAAEFSKAYFVAVDAMRQSCEKGGGKFSRGMAVGLLEAHFSDATTIVQAGTKLTREVKDELFMTFVMGCGKRFEEMTPKEKKPAAVALADIAGVTPNLTSAEIRRRIAAYRRAYPTAACTPSAIAAHWSEFGASTGQTYHAQQTLAPRGWEQHAEAMFKAADWEAGAIRYLIGKGWDGMNSEQQAGVRRIALGIQAAPTNRTDDQILSGLSVDLTSKLVEE